MTRKYNIIYTDPPWSYRDKRDKHPRMCGGALSHYPTMTISDIKALPVQSLAADDCMLFLWATFPNLQEALDVIKAWGFTYKTLAFSWIKTNKKNGKPFFGIGYYTKSNCEVCLLATRGKPKVLSNSVSSVIIAPREEHSKKPAQVRDKIVQLCGDLPRLEMFARQATDGWELFGNQVDNSIYMPEAVPLLTLEEVEDLKQSVAQRQEDMLDVRYPGVFE